MNPTGTVLVILTAFLLGLLGGVAIQSRPLSVVQSGNTGCIGFSAMEFEPETATLKVEFQNIYGQRPCVAEDHIGGK